MADLDRRLEIAKAKFNRAIDRFSRRFGRVELDLLVSNIPLPENSLLRSAILYAISHHGHLLSFLGAPIRSTLKKTSAIYIEQDRIKISSHLEHKQLFIIFLLGAVSFAIELFLDESESKTPQEMKKNFNVHINTQIPLFPPDLVEALSQLETFSTIQMMETIYSEKELQELKKEQLNYFINLLEKDHPDFFARLKDLGVEAKIKAFATLGGAL